LPFLGLYSILRGRRRTSGRAWQNSRSEIKFKGLSLKNSQSSNHYQVLKFCQETCVTSSYLESWEVVPSCFKTAAGRWLNRSADCMPEVAIKRYQACYRSGAVVGHLLHPWLPPEAYWANLKSEEYDVCCQPGKVERCKDKLFSHHRIPCIRRCLPNCPWPKLQGYCRISHLISKSLVSFLDQEPKRKEGLPFCGFPFGSVDHLRAFLPEFQVSLPSGSGEHSWL